MRMGNYFLITEYCPGPLYMGWHAYLRESKGRQQRNSDGDWGWIRWRGTRDGEHPAQAVLDALGLTMRSDGSCDDDAYAAIAKMHPIPRQRIGGKARGCIPVVLDEWGRITPARDPRAAVFKGKGRKAKARRK